MFANSIHSPRNHPFTLKQSGHYIIKPFGGEMPFTKVASWHAFTAKYTVRDQLRVFKQSRIGSISLISTSKAA